jgi:5-methylthioadenosine/S-adenosylhomocysteine deaminase
MSLLLKNARIINPNSFSANNFLTKDIFIKSNVIDMISDKISDELIDNIKKNDNKNIRVFDCEGKLVLPGFVNMHTHCAMSLFRGYGDDMPLHDWLSKKIWPIEAKLTEEDCYWNARFAFIEMIKSGITCFFDMYWHLDGVLRAAVDSGIRGYCSQVMIDMFDENKSKESINTVLKNYKYFSNNIEGYCDRIKMILGPHAIYTVSEKTLLWCKKFSEEQNIFINIHLSETEKEVDDCIKKYGVRPVEYLEKIKFLKNNIVFAHSIWLDEKEIDILKKYNICVVHNPISNMKLSVGGKFPLKKYVDKNIFTTLGTDSVSSNNSLDMFETMKFASLLSKHNYVNPIITNSREIYSMATKNAYDFLGIKGGEIKEGFIADFILLDLNHYSLIPCNDIFSNLVYSAKPECIDSVICNGQIIMKNRKIDGEDIIRDKVKGISLRLLNK